MRSERVRLVIKLPEVEESHSGHVPDGFVSRICVGQC
jgi:hypothetical protein